MIQSALTLLWGLQVALAQTAPAPTGPFEQLQAVCTATTAELQRNNPADAIGELARLAPLATLRAARLPSGIHHVLSACTATSPLTAGSAPDCTKPWTAESDPSIELYSLGATLGDLTLTLAHDEGRVRDLDGNPTPIAGAERRALVSCSETAAALTAHLARTVPEQDDRGRGLLGSSALVVLADRIHRHVGSSNERIAIQAALLRRGADIVSSSALTQLTLVEREVVTFGAATAAHTAATTLAAPSTSGVAPQPPSPPSDQAVMDAINAASRAATLPWISPAWRGQAALAANQLLARYEDVVGPVLPAGKGAFDNHRDAWRRGLIESVFGGANDTCGPWDPALELPAAAKSPEPGGDDASVAVAAALMLTPGREILPSLSPWAQTWPNHRIDRVLCRLALRSGERLATPAALLYAHRLVDPQLRTVLAEDVERARVFGLIALQDAMWLRRNDQVPAGTGWVDHFGDLLVPLLQIGWSSTTSNAYRTLEAWAAQDASAWLVGEAGSPTWMTTPRRHPRRVP